MGEIVKIWEVIDTSTEAIQWQRKYGRHPSARLANQQAARIRSRGLMCEVQEVDLRVSELRDYLGGSLPLYLWRLRAAIERYRFQRGL